jgi:uncharacterized protein YjdB
MLKKCLTILLALSLVFSSFPTSIFLQVQAIQLPAQKDLFVYNGGTSDTTYIDPNSPNTSILVNFFGNIWRNVVGSNSITYKVDLPDNCSAIYFNLYSFDVGRVDVSADKITWISTTYDSANYNYEPADQSFITDNNSKTIYVKVSAPNGSSFTYGSMLVKYTAFGKELPGANTRMSTLFNVGSIEETGRLYAYSGNADAGLGDFYGNKKRDITGSGYVIYRFGLPDNTTSFSLTSWSWGNIKTSISTDNITWVLTSNKTVASPDAILLAGSGDGDFLVKENDKAIYVKLETTSTMSFCNMLLYYSTSASMNIPTQKDIWVYNGDTSDNYYIDPNSSNTSTIPQSDFTIMESGIAMDTTLIDPLSTNNSDVIWTWWRQVYHSQTVTYKIDLADNTSSIASLVALQLYEGTNAKIEISANKTDWVLATQNGTGYTISFTPQNQSFLTDNASKIVYIRVTMLDILSITPYMYTNFHIKYTTGRNIVGTNSITYKVDLPDNCNNIYFNVPGSDNGKVEVSANKSTWVSTEYDGATKNFLPVDQSFLSGNTAKIIYIRISSKDGNSYSYDSFMLKYNAYGEEPAGINTTLNSLLYVGKVESEYSRLYDYSGEANAGLAAYYGELKRVITGNGYIIYKFILPDNATAFNVSSWSWGNIKASISKDGSIWTTTFNQTIADPASNILASCSNDSFVSYGSDNIIYVKLETTSTMSMCYIQMQYTLGSAFTRSSTNAVSESVNLAPMTTAVSNLFSIASQDQSIVYDSNTLYFFDLKAVIDTAKSAGVQDKVLYDTVNLVASMQGIVNKNGSHLMINFITNSFNYPYFNSTAGKFTGTPDTYWYNYLRQPGRYLADKTVVTVSSVGKIVDLFKNQISGAVVWDPEVVATENAASTAAGVDNLIPMRYDRGLGVYDWFVRRNAIFTVGRNLYKLFDGYNTIPDTNLQSTGSKKADAYLWAKALYLDTGLASATIMTYTLDAYSWYNNAISYPDLENNNLVNKDYYIAKKAFFFDLSVWPYQRPADDKMQVPGTDYRILCDVLKKQNQLANGNVITIGGFPPWWLKYTIAADASFPGAGETETQSIKVFSTYYAQLDADAGKGISNASVTRNVPLQSSYTQNSKTVTTTLQNKNYICFYMGDYDSGAWTASLMPQFWNDPNRGQIPIAWGISSAAASRIPHVIDYMYSTKTANDYFVSANNGTGYLNTQYLVDPSRPAGLLGTKDSWISHNQTSAAQFDLDIMGLSIFDADPVSNELLNIQRAISPKGAALSRSPGSLVINGTPFIKQFTAAGPGTDVAYSSWYINSVTVDPVAQPEFSFYRMVWSSPTDMVAIYNKLLADYPSRNFQIVNPYTFFDLYRQAKGVTATGVILDKSTMSIQKTTTGTLTATVLPSNARNVNVSWSSSNSAVATVNSSGVVTGVSVGTATITATAQDGSFTATSVVTIQPKVNGVMNGLVYTSREGILSISFENASAVLNSVAFVSGEQINATGEYILIVTDNDTGNSTTVGFSYIKFGDVTGNGLIDLIDLAKMKAHLLKSDLLTGIYKKAGIISNKEDISIIDLIAVKKHILGISLIS